MEHSGWKQPRKSDFRRIREKIEKRKKLLDAGATQLDVCAALPPRSWAKIRKKITQLRRKDFTVTKPQLPMEQHETLAQYREQNLEQAITIDAEVLASWQPQIPPNAEFHRPRRLNLARLNSDNTTLILQLNQALSN
jgi:hypothetical protein